MYTKLSFTIFSLLVVSFIELALSSPIDTDAQKAKTNQTQVSAAMRKVIISSAEFPPNDSKNFLKQGAYYGGARSSLAADDLIQKAMSWGMGFTTIQYNSHQVKGAAFIPGPPDDFSETWNDGAYALALTCHKYGQDAVDKLNANCKNCGKTYVSAIVWGTYNGMNFDKDLILNAGCTALEVTDSEKCFTNFPNDCSIRAVGEAVDLWNQRTKRIVRNAKSRGAILAAIKEYAAKTHQKITIPPK